jgi:hypothetical protein
MRAHEVINQRVARPGVAGDRILACLHISHIGDATYVEHRQRARPVEIPRNGLMEGGNDRRALPARRHVGGAKIMRDRDPEAFRQPCAVADLHRQPLLRLVQNRLAVKPDKGHIGGHDLIAVQKLLNDLGMDFCDESFRPFQHAGPLPPFGERSAFCQCIPQQPPLALRIRPISGRTEADDGFAIGLDQRHVDAVQ